MKSAVSSLTYFVHRLNGTPFKFCAAQYMRILKIEKAHRILILNAKGGCGKTTIATNLACQYARENQPTVLVDYDPQGSSTQWLAVRPKELPHIRSVTAHKVSNQTTRTWQLRLPEGTKRVVVDTPARLDHMQASKLIREADTILVPVLASSIDIRAAHQFIRELLKDPEIRNKSKRIAVMGNRVRKGTCAYIQLQEFLQELGIPFITNLRDTQHYVRAAAEGIGIQELKLKSAEQDQAQWHSLVRWIEGEQNSQLQASG